MKVGILVAMVAIGYPARACWSVLLRFSQDMLWCRLVSLSVSITYRTKFLRWGLPSAMLIEAHSSPVRGLSLEIGQARNLDALESRWCRILSSMLSLSSLQVTGRIGQHYVCLKSSEGCVVEGIAMKQTYRFRDCAGHQQGILAAGHFPLTSRSASRYTGLLSKRLVHQKICLLSSGRSWYLPLHSPSTGVTGLLRVFCLFLFGFLVIFYMRNRYSVCERLF